MLNSQIIVVGSSNTDLMVHIPRLPLPGETVLGADLMIAPGGKGANQAVAAARLGARVLFIARIGQDLFGQTALQNLHAERLDIRYLRQDATAPSGVALIMVGPEGQNIIAVAPGANSRLTPAEVQAAAAEFAQAKVVLLQLESPLDTVWAAAQAGRAAGSTLVLNPAPAQPLPAPLLQLVDILTPNAAEAMSLSGESTVEAAALALLRWGVKVAIVTLGEAGVLVATSPDRLSYQPGFKVDAIDTTAAGDAFNGGLAAALAQGQSLNSAVHYAQAVAALSVTRRGAQPSLPYGDEVSIFLQNVHLGRR